MVTGRLLVGRGKILEEENKWEEAIASLEEAAPYVDERARFAEREVCFDTALVSLELAAVYAKQGRTQEVKTIARHLVPVFQAQDVHREALAALTSFAKRPNGRKSRSSLPTGSLPT